MAFKDFSFKIPFKCFIAFNYLYYYKTNIFSY